MLSPLLECTVMMVVIGLAVRERCAIARQPDPADPPLLSDSKSPSNKIHAR